MATKTTLTKDELVDLLKKLKTGAEQYQRQAEQMEQARRQEAQDTMARAFPVEPKSPLNNEDTWELARLVDMERELLRLRQELQATGDAYNRLEAQVSAAERQVELQRNVVQRIVRGPHVYPESAPRP